jgi:hypothetical protein
MVKHPPRTVSEDMELHPWKYDDYDGPRPYPKPGPLAHLELRAQKRPRRQPRNVVSRLTERITGVSDLRTELTVGAQGRQRILSVD